MGSINRGRIVKNKFCPIRIHLFGYSSKKFDIVIRLSFNFSLDHDPTETSNLAAHYPSLVETFLKKLAVYDANSYPTFYPPRDPAADPKLHNGTWGPWQDKPNDWPRSLTSADVENDVILH